MVEHEIIDLLSSDDESVPSAGKEKDKPPPPKEEVVPNIHKSKNFGRGLLAVKKKTAPQHVSGSTKTIIPGIGTNDMGRQTSTTPKKKTATWLSASKHSSSSSGTSKPVAAKKITPLPQPAAAATATTTTTTPKDETKLPPQSVPTPSEIKKTCWVCEIPLTVNFGFCMYTMHKHPLLEVPCCCVCADAMAALSVAHEEASSSSSTDNSKTNDDDDDDICAACGSEENDLLILCDDCNRQYCQRCLARAYGGGSEGWDYVQTKILASKTSRWLCPCCEPPDFLKQLVEQVEEEKARKDENRQFETIHGELHQVYEERQHALAILDNEDDKRQEITNELRLEHNLNGKGLAEAVESELEAWREEWNNHLKRLEYHEATLQDEIERVGGTDFDLPAVYESMGIARPEVKDKEDPDWVRAADFALAKRDREQPRPAAPYVLLQDDYNDVEDLVDSEGDDSDGANAPVSLGAQHRSGFRKMAAGNEVTKEMIAEAKMMEDECYPILKTAKKVTEKADRAACEQEEIAVSNRGFRSDEKFIVQSRRKANARRKQVTTSSACDKNKVASRSSEKHMYSASSKTTAGSNKEKTSESDPLPTSITKKGETSSCAKFDLASLPAELQKALKSHQLEGVNFMHENCFGNGTISPGGCVLAHNMGLGKTATALAFLFAATKAELVQSALIVVPTNTIGNWKREFERWIGYDVRGNALYLEDLDEAKADSKVSKVKRFMRIEGPRALLVSHQTFSKVVDEARGADIVIIDEAHIPLSNSATQGFKALSKVETKLRIALTGTPISNNLVEYHNMMKFIRPGLLPEIVDFERFFITPIKRGLPKDCSAEEKLKSDLKSAELYKILKPHVNRKDASPLFEELPNLTQVALYISPSKLQQSIYRSFKLLRRKDEDFKNFFRAYKALAPINNHPATLLKKSGKDDDDDTKKIKTWWMHLRNRIGDEALTSIDAGYKIVLLLQLLVMAEQRGEKVLIFSGCLKTLDFLEEVLQSDNWRSAVPGVVALDTSETSAWEKDTHYFRIDGSRLASERSRSIEEFESSSNARAFLLSVRAAGLGINLTAASRVVLLETDFNPAVSSQAIFRSYRYGQTQPVHVYRFLTRGTMEEKIHARCVTKTGLSHRVIDKMTMSRDFSQREIADLSQSFNWVQCDKCSKWRVMYDYSGGEEELPEKWFCSMNTDLKNNSCSLPERDAVWYEDEIAGRHDGEGQDTIVSDSSDDNREEDDEHLIQQDPILQSLLELTNSNQTKIITKYKFQCKPQKPKGGSRSAASAASTVTEKSHWNGQWKKPSSTDERPDKIKTAENDRAVFTPQSPRSGTRSKRSLQPTRLTPTGKGELETSRKNQEGTESPMRRSPRRQENSTLRQTAVHRQESNSHQQTANTTAKKRKAPASPSSPHLKVDKKTAPATTSDVDSIMDGETVLPEGAFLV